MHGLVNRSLQNFVQDVYGSEAWRDIADEAGLDGEEFEAMLTYEDALTFSVIDAACARLGKARETLLEDAGTYLVTHPNTWRIRRLLRFGGADMIDFLESLDDLPDRARLAVPDLELPTLRLHNGAGDEGHYILSCGGKGTGVEFVALGCLRAMADDYGALAVAELLPARAGDKDISRIEVIVASTDFAEGKSFALTREMH